MNPMIQPLNDFSIGWSTWLWRATWQAAIVIAVAWVLTVVLARQSPRFRSWIWRLAYVKLLVLLIWTTPLRLAVLPAAEVSESTNVQPLSAQPDPDIKPRPPVALNEAGLSNQKSVITNHEPDAIYKDSLSGEAIPPLTPSDASVVSTSDLRPPNATSQPAIPLTWQSWLLLAWLIGLAAVLTWLAAGILRAARLWRSARLIDHQDLDHLLQDVRRDLKLRPQVQLAQSHLATGPMLVKFLNARIIFPAEMIDELSLDEIRLVLAHELAHIKRRDLAWNALAAVVHIALYFHPLVWLAHHFSRREQELACDELVVTRLAVERHDYGQMLVNVARQISWNFRPGIATVGMSGSYKTLSRRLEAMKTIRQFTSKQIAIATCATCLLAAIAIIPWRLVAQERPAADPARPAGVLQDPRQPAADANRPAADPAQPTPPAKATAENELKGKSAEEKLLVGTWRGGPTNGEVVFRADGSYREFSLLDASADRSALGGQGKNVHGTWQIKDKLVVLRDEPEIPIMRGLTQPPFGVGFQYRRFKIVRLDDSLLRLQELSPGFVGNEAAPRWWLAAQAEGLGPLLFFRRDASATAEEKFDPSIPADLVHIAELARMSPAEALSMVEWFNEANQEAIRSREALHWDVLARVADAKRGKTHFAQLFGLSAGEEKAYLDLREMGVDFPRACDLEGLKHLSTDEAGAVKKLEALSGDFDRLNRGLHALRGDGMGVARTGQANPALLPKFQTEQEAAEKLCLLVDELTNYLAATVFLGQQPGGGVPGGFSPPFAPYYGGAAGPAAVAAPQPGVPNPGADHGPAPAGDAIIAPRTPWDGQPPGASPAAGQLR